MRNFRILGPFLQFDILNGLGSEEEHSNYAILMVLDLIGNKIFPYILYVQITTNERRMTHCCSQSLLYIVLLLALVYVIVCISISISMCMYRISIYNMRRGKPKYTKPSIFSSDGNKGFCMGIETITHSDCHM